MSDNSKAEAKSSSASEHRIRDIQKRDLMVIRHLMSDYPGFTSLSPHDQLDRIILVLESICGFGAVSVETIYQLKEVYTNIPDDLSNYFATSIYQNDSSGERKNKYRESFEGAYRLDRDFKQNLSREGEDSNGDEPIRKKIPGKKRSQVANPVVSRRKPSATSVKPSTSVMSSQLSTHDVDKGPDSTKKSSLPILVIVAGLVLVVMVAIILVLNH